MEVFIFPFSVLFNFSYNKIYKILVILAYSYNIFHNFNRSFYKNGFLIDNRSEIMKHHLKGPIYMDLLCIISLVFIGSLC